MKYFVTTEEHTKWSAVNKQWCTVCPHLGKTNFYFMSKTYYNEITCSKKYSNNSIILINYKNNYLKDKNNNACYFILGLY